MMATKKSTAAHYVNNKEFYAAMVVYIAEVRAARAAGAEKPVPSNFIGDCLIKIANHLSYKPNFVGYSYREEMVLDAIENCITYIDRFDPEKSENPFAYFTQISYYAFLRRIQKEKKAADARDRMILNTDFSDLFNQKGDDSDRAAGLVNYLKRQIDNAKRDSSMPPVEKKATTRRPKYMAGKDTNTEPLFADEPEELPES